MDAKCIMVYTSISGNTEEIAKAIAEGIKQAGSEVVVKEMYNTDASEIEKYDCILLGSCTWGQGELPDEALCFYEDMDSLHLQGKKATAFGSCDSNYDSYGAAVDLFLHKLSERGADIVLEGMKLELMPSESEAAECRKYGKAFIEKSLNLEQ